MGRHGNWMVAIAIAGLAGAWTVDVGDGARARVSDGAFAGCDVPGRDWPQRDPSLPDGYARSTDLVADLHAMWETAPLEGANGNASTARAIAAASRVFHTVELVGRTGAEVKALLGSPTKSNDSVYRGQPFWPLRARGMIYRFDSGTGGWQFNVYCGGDDQVVTEVERRWIH